MENYIGRLLDNRYEILEAIGNGGMAVVYKALDHRLNRMVAVKVLKDDLSRNLDFRKRFHAESQAIAMLSHPNIVSVYDVSRSGESDYIVMELIEGITLKQYLEKKGRLNWRETLHFSMQIAKALDHAHNRGIVHRDIKPHNIMILKDGSIKVADFGIARIASAQNTLTREALGSVHYISPEQAKGARVDNRSDLYSLGVVMYEMLTGTPPYDGESPVAVAIQHINGGARVPSELVEGIPLGLEQITMHAMLASADARYSNATEMLRDMEEFRKNPAITFVFGAAAAVRPAGMTRTEAERYAAARAAAARAPKGPVDNRTVEERRVERARRDAERAAEKRRKNLTIWIAVAAGVAVILMILLIVLLAGGNQSEEETTDTTGISEVEEVKVPNLIGMELSEIDPEDYEDFEIKLAADQLRYETTDKYDPGYVIDQTPEPGDVVRPGRSITLTISVAPDSILMPNFVNTLGTDAMTALNNLKLGLKISIEEERDDAVPKGYVVRTDPVANTELEKGQSVTIYVGTGTSKMPDLKNMSKERASQMMDDLDVRVQVRFIEEESDTISEGYVIRTDPAAWSDLTKGQQVYIYVSIGTTRVEVPEVLTLPIETAKQLIEDAGLRFEFVERASNAEPGTVLEQTPVAGTMVEKGSTVILYISTGPETPPDSTTEEPTESTEPSSSEEPTESTEPSSSEEPTESTETPSSGEPSEPPENGNP